MTDRANAARRANRFLSALRSFRDKCQYPVPDTFTKDEPGRATQRLHRLIGVVPVRVLAAAAAGLLTAAAGCSSSGAGLDAGVSTVSGGPATVTVQDLSFRPGDLTVDVGAKVTWTFEDPVQHDVSADDGKFMSDELNRGHSYSFRFDTAGSYDYTCTIHPRMRGRVTVR